MFRHTAATFRATLLGLVLAVPFASLAAAQETRPFADDVGTVEIPVHPQRIVALHDIGQTIPLIEMGVMPVGSGGRVAADGSFYIRSSLSLTGVDYSNSDIRYVDAADFEAIAALHPDLIMASSADTLAQLSQIAPTIVLSRNVNPGLEQLRKIADAAGVLDRFEAAEARFNGQIETLRAMIPNAGDIVVSMVDAGDGTLTAHRHQSRGSLGYILSAVGFAMPDLVAGLETEGMPISAEQLPEVDGDFILTTYRLDFGQHPADAWNYFETALPGWCDFLHACRTNQIVAISRDEALAISFSAFDLMIFAIQTNIAGRRFVPLDE